MKQQIQKWLRPLLFIAAGVLAGFLYYHFFGCTTGCPITSSPWRTMLYMGVIGGLLSVIFGKGTNDSCST